MSSNSERSCSTRHCSLTRRPSQWPCSWASSNTPTTSPSVYSIQEAGMTSHLEFPAAMGLDPRPFPLSSIVAFGLSQPKLSKSGGPTVSLALYGHPFSSYTQKVLIALYENGTPFEFRLDRTQAFSNSRAPLLPPQTDADGR